MQKLTVVDVVEGSAVLDVAGLEHLVLFRENERGRVMECLGLFPTLGAVRQYVRQQDRPLLSVEACSTHRLFNVADGFVYIALDDVGLDPRDLWQVWMELFFLPEEQLDFDELEALSLPVGDCTRLTERTKSQLNAKTLPLSLPVREFVVHSITAPGDFEEVARIGDTQDMEELVQRVFARYDITYSGMLQQVGGSLDGWLSGDEGSLVDRVPGRCYLRLFLPRLRGLVAAWLGENPKVDDLVEVMLVAKYFGFMAVDYGQHEVVVSTQGRLHIQEGRMSSLSVLYDLVLYRRAGCDGVVGMDFLLDSGGSDRQDVGIAAGLPAGGVDLQSSRVSLEPGGGALRPSVGLKEPKGMCDVCHYLVRLEGHAGRCKPVSEIDHQYKELIRKCGWLGDIRHGGDVRTVLLAANIPLVDIEREAQKYTAGAAQARWYSEYSGSKWKPAGSSVHSFATAFEASYTGDFRRDYITQLVLRYKLVYQSDEVVLSMKEDKGLIYLEYPMSGLFSLE